MAKTANKPFYAAVETYKFVRLFPLNQFDLPSHVSATNLLGGSNFSSGEAAEFLDKDHPTVDYTPPDYISLLLTDVGILTPSGISDELIKLYL